MGIGAFPGDHPLALGMLGLHGTAYANYAVAKADLLIAVGARFDDRVTCRVDGFAKEATIVHIDIDAAEIGKVVPADIPAVGDAKAILSALLPLVAEKRHDEWLAQIAQWKEEYRLRYHARPGVIAPQQVIEELYHVTRGEAICTADVGQHQMWLAQYYPFRQPRSHLSSGGLGTMGFGFPAAIGAKIALPHRSVWSIVGDGGMQMSLSELATVAAHRIPVKIAVLNNNSLGMVRQIQELSYQRRYIAVDLAGNPDFVAIAQAYGVAARRVDDPAELRPALEWAERYDGPMLLDIHIDPAANVYPMVPPGRCDRRDDRDQGVRRNRLIETCPGTGPPFCSWPPEAQSPSRISGPAIAPALFFSQTKQKLDIPPLTPRGSRSTLKVRLGCPKLTVKGVRPWLSRHTIPSQQGAT